MAESFWADETGILFDETGIIACEDCPCGNAVCNVCIDLDAPATIVGMFSGPALTAGSCTGFGSLAWYLTNGFEIPFDAPAMTGTDCYWKGDTGYPTGDPNQYHQLTIRYTNLGGMPAVAYQLHLVIGGVITDLLASGTLPVADVGGLIDCFAPRTIDGLFDCFPFDEVLTLDIN